MPSMPIAIQLLTERDLPAVMRLKETAGWNQTVSDWQRLLRLEPRGCFAAWLNGELVATTTTTSYGTDLAWIGMVLVDPAHRRGGIATQLMRTAMDYLRAAGVGTIKLDATPAGQPVYDALGFVQEGLVERWAGIPQTISANACQPLVAELLPQVWTLDRKAFGADRRELLADLLADVHAAPLALCADDGKLRGYALARGGTRAVYLGPLVAAERTGALILLDEMLAQLRGQEVFCDLHTASLLKSADLLARGFSKQRDLVRMRLDDERAAGTAPEICAIAGLEVG